MESLQSMEYEYEMNLDRTHKSLQFKTMFGIPLLSSEWPVNRNLVYYGQYAVT